MERKHNICDVPIPIRTSYTGDGTTKIQNGKRIVPVLERKLLDSSCTALFHIIPPLQNHLPKNSLAISVLALEDGKVGALRNLYVSNKLHALLALLLLLK